MTCRARQRSGSTLVLTAPRLVFVHERSGRLRAAGSAVRGPRTVYTKNSLTSLPARSIAFSSDRSPTNTRPVLPSALRVTRVSKRCTACAGMRLGWM